MEDLTSQEEAAVELFDSLQIPIPVHRSVEGQLRRDIEHALEQVQHCSSGDISFRLKLAYALLCVDRRDEAAVVFEQLQDSTDIVRVRIIACIERGILLCQKRELEVGLELADQLGDVDDDYFRLQIVERGKYQLGRLLFLENNFANAVRYLEAGLNFWKDGFGVHYYLGISYTRIGDYTKAEEHLRISVRLSPGSSELYRELYHHLGDVYFQCARYQEAVQAFVQSATHASELPAESYKWWCAGSITAKNCGDYEKAVEYFILSLKAALKIQEPDLQAPRLTAASTWLYTCIGVKLQTGITFDEFLQVNHVEYITFEETVNTQEADDERVILQNTKHTKQEHLRTLQAEGYGTLGIAMLAYQAYKDAREHLQRAVDLLRQNSQDGDTFGLREKLLYRFQWSQAVLFAVLREDEKALDAFQQCKCVAPTEKDRLQCDIRSCLALKRMGKFVTTASMFAQLAVEHSSLIESEFELKVDILVGLGQSLLGVGKTGQAIEHLEAARCLLEDRGCYTSDYLPLTYTVLYNALIERGLFARAFELISNFNSVVRKHHAGSRHEQVLHLFAADFSRNLNDNKASEDMIELLDVQNMEDQELRCGALAALANVYRNQGDYDAAEAKYSKAITSLPPGHNDLLLSQVYRNRAALYMSKAAVAQQNGEAVEISMELNRKALQDYDQVIQTFEESGVLSLDLASAYTGQAIVLHHTNEHKAAGEKLDRAMELAGDNELLKAKIKRVRANLLFASNQFEEAMREGVEAALLFADIQLKLQDLESAWVTLLEGDMKHLYFQLQRAWVIGRENYMNALLWAERSRLRLYFHLADQRLDESLLDPPLAFDRDNDHARDCIASAVKASGRGCVFVEYTFSPAQDVLYLYVVRHQMDDLTVDFKSVSLKDFFAAEENRVHRGSIDALVRRTRTEIKRKLEDEAKAGLGALYRLLVKPVWELLERHETVIFAPAGSIWLVPFAALYDETCSQFLIQKKNVGVVPSLRALRRCQLRYQNVNAGMKTSKAGFVAGDPEPMGLNSGQLPGARREAIEVAEKLGVAPVIGRGMTKEAVIQGLESESRVIALVTHGMVDRIHPHGALVMQGKQHQEENMKKKMVDIERLVLQSSIDPRHSSGDLEQSKSEVLTAREIGKLDIRASLVVLSACQTGEGEVPSEGLLGLARAVLQAGSSCAVVTLWRVDDDATKKLMTGMFQELVSNKRSVVNSLRVSMLKLLESGAPVYKWASAAAVGYSMLRLYPMAEGSESPPVLAAQEVLSPKETLVGAVNLITNSGSTPPRPRPKPKTKNSFCCWKC